MKKCLIYVCVFMLLLCCFSPVAFADGNNNSVSDSTDQGHDNIQISVLRVSPSDTSGLHALVLQLLGDYNPVVKDYTYTSSSGYTTHSVDIQPDYSWIATAVIFVVVIYCVFRLLGSIFSGRL